VKHDERAWVLPAVFLLMGLSLPAQLIVADNIAEPYPGLFQPAFRGVSQDDHRVERLEVLELALDGRRIRAFDVFPTDGNARVIFASVFPPEGDEARIDAVTRRSMRARLARRLDTDPATLTVTWRRRTLRLDSGKISRGSTLAHYRVDLREHTS
jgi:hypothetical protein